MTAGGPQGLNLRSLLEEMIEKDASDLHIVAGERPKVRVDGDIVNSSVEHVLTPKDTLSIAYSVLTENQKKRFETENELDFSFGISTCVRSRISACRPWWRSSPRSPAGWSWSRGPPARGRARPSRR